MRQNITPWKEKTHSAGPYRVTLGTKKFLNPMEPPGQPRGGAKFGGDWKIPLSLYRRHTNTHIHTDTHCSFI